MVVKTFRPYHERSVSEGFLVQGGGEYRAVGSAEKVGILGN